MEFYKWLNTFIEEKELENEIYKIEHNGYIHYVQLNTVLDLIRISATEEKKKIKEKIIQIDFYNGDLHHFFRYLAEAYIKINY